MILAFCRIALAGQVALHLDSPDVREGQTVGLTLTVTDASPRGVPDLDLASGLSATFAGQSQAREMVNFKTSVSTIFHYELSALARGHYTLGPVSVNTSAGTLVAPPVLLDVGARPEAGTLDALVGDLGAGAVYVGQVVVYHLRFTTANHVVSGRWAPPDADGFMAEPSVDPLTSEYPMTDGGKSVSVEELFFPLRATKVGSTTIPGGVFQAQFAVSRSRRGGRPDLFRDIPGFSDVRSENYSSAPIAVDINAVPTAGRPSDYDGLVGHFSVETKASAADVKVGDTVTIEVTVTGNGSLSSAKLPPLTGQGFRVYDDQPAVEARIADGKYASVATFKRAIVPESPGDLSVPAAALSWFDPETRSFVSAASEPLLLHVSGAAGNADVTSFGDAAPHGVDPLGEDILPVRTEARLSAPITGQRAWMLQVPGALLVVAGLVRRFRPRRVATVKAYGFSDLPTEPEARIAGLERILREAAAQKLSLSSEGLTVDDLAPLGADAVRVYKQLVAMRYGKDSGQLPESDVRALVAGWRQ